jgi:purine-cytosine permease-like protein
VVAIIIAQIVAGALGLLLHMFYTKKFVGYEPLKQIKDLLIPPAIAACIVVVLFNALQAVTNNFYAFGLQIVSFSCIYLLSASITGRSEVKFFKELLSAGLGKRNSSE